MLNHEELEQLAKSVIDWMAWELQSPHTINRLAFGEQLEVHNLLLASSAGLSIPGCLRVRVVVDVDKPASASAQVLGVVWRKPTKR